MPDFKTPEDRIAFIKAGGLEPYDMLRIWRFARSDSVWFLPPVGDVFAQAFADMRVSLTDPEWTALSKKVGWDQ